MTPILRGNCPDPAPIPLSSSGARRRTHLAALAVVATLATSVLSVVTGSGVAAAGEVGAGSYTETLPPGRLLPKGCGTIASNPRLFLTADAPTGAVPTNDWWSSLLWKRYDCAYSEPLHAHPVSYDTFNNGLGLSYTSKARIIGGTTGVSEYKFDYDEDIRVGVTAMGAPVVKVADWTDWTVTPYWSDGQRTMKATIGHGLPFSYYEITGGNAQITGSKVAPTVWSNSGSMIGFSIGADNYAAYAPAGASWSVSGGVITSTLAGKGYFSVAVLPEGGDRQQLAADYARYAHAHVTGTSMSYSFDESTSTVSTTYQLITTALEGAETATVASLYPHQWRNLAGASPIAASYASARGRMKNLLGATSFTTRMTFQGVLPEVPAVADSAGADLTTITNYLAAELGDPAKILGQDTYWTGKGLGRAARIAEIADQLGITNVRNAALQVIKQRLIDWFTAGPGETGQLFYYDRNWGTLIGYPASYFSEEDLNDHHFHYGYFVAAAATLAKFDPQWAAGSQYGGMVDLLIRDANNYDRTDERFPYLRDYDIYAGHDWASGLAPFFSGNNQESSSEGMNFANGLIQWGQATNDKAIRDAGIFIYTTQAQAIAEYWFDVHDENFPAEFGRATVGMVWGDGGAYATWFSAEPEMIQGINMLPVTGGHLYFGDYPEYVTTNYEDLLRNNFGKPTVWQDIIWNFLAAGDGDRALQEFRANPGYTPEEGESRAHTFHWIRNLAALGTVDNTVTANHPLARVFIKNGQRTYVASNITAEDLTVTFSNGTALLAPAGKTATSGAFAWSGGSATGGRIVPTGSPSPTPTGSPSPSPTGSASPTASPSPSRSPSPSPTASPFRATQYLLSSGALGQPAAAEGSVSVQAANGNHDGVPTNAKVFTATGLNAVHNGQTTTFDLFVDAGNGVGNGVQARVSYDLTGDGVFDRVETYGYYATDPVSGWEHYRQTMGLRSATGTHGDLANGTVKVEVWNAIGGSDTTLGTGNTSQVSLPFVGATTSPSPTVDPGTFTATRYLQAGNQLAGSQGAAGSTTISAADGNWVGTPHDPQVFTATGLTATHSGGQTSFDVFLDAGTGVGNGTHVRVSYDLTGDGTFDRIETYSYFATDPVTGWEHYTQAKGLLSADGSLGNLAGGTVKVEVWNAIGSNGTSLGIGNQSKFVLPFTA